MTPPRDASANAMFAADLARRAADAERARDFPAAIAALREARRLAPRDPAIARRLGVTLMRSGDRVEPIAALRAAVGLAPRDAGALHDLGLALFRAGQFGEAARTFERASSLEPNLAIHLVRWGATLERTHDLPGAAAALDRALGVDPMNGEAQVIRAELAVRMNDLDDALARFAAIDYSRIGPEMAARAWNAHGRALEKRGDHDGAWGAHTRSNEVLLATPEAQAALGTPVDSVMRETLADATPEMFARWRDEAPKGEPRVIWLAGMPRSGTTLAEQILSMFPNVATNDEHARASIVYDALTSETGGPSDRSTIARLDALTPTQVATLRTLFHDEIRRSIGDPKPNTVLIDKQPMRLIDVALVQRLFPASRMVMMVRDPRDVCLSAYFQVFNPRPVMSRFLRIDTTARLYADCMDFWVRIRSLPTFGIREVRYEDLVRDFEPTLRALAEFLDLPWTDAVHRFATDARNKNVRSASYLAVRQGLNDRSIGRWRTYATHLAPVLPVLKPAIDAYGFDPS